jgi:hypothetical protein
MRIAFYVLRQTLNDLGDLEGWILSPICKCLISG